VEHGDFESPILEQKVGHEANRQMRRLGDVRFWYLIPAEHYHGRARAEIITVPIQVFLPYPYVLVKEHLLNTRLIEC